MDATVLRLLAVEDSEEDSALLLRRLRREGFAVEMLRVDTADAMRAALLERSFDAVVSDHNMPSFDSFGALTILRETGLDLPFIVVSASIGEDAAVELMRRGAHDFVMKDNANRLGQVVRRELQEAKNRRERREALESLHQRNMQLEALNSRLRRLVEVARGLSGCTNLAEFGRRLIEDFARNMAATGGSIYVAEEKGLRLVHALDPAHAPEFVPFPLRDLSAFHRALTTGEVTYVQDTSQELVVESSGWTGYRDGTALVFPLLDEAGNTLGVLSLHNKEVPPFTEQDREIGTILASYSCEAFKAIRASEALQQSEHRFREIAETLPQFIYEADTTGKVTFANSRSVEFFGYTREQLQKGVIIHDVVAAESRELARTSFQKILKEGARSRGSEYLALRKDGSKFPILSYAAPIEREGEIVGIRGIVVDISELKAAREQGDLLMQAIEQAIESTIITDANGVIQYVNPAFERVSGYTREEAVGQTPRILKSGEHDAAFYQDLWSTIAAGAVYHSRIVNKRKDGALFTEEMTISPVRDASGQITNYIAVKRDITRELDLETQYRQAQRMEAIGRLAGGVAHDFNNILQGILGYAEVTRRALPSDGPLHEYVGEITKAGQRAAVLVRQLLTFSRRQAMNQETLDLNAVTDDLLKMLRRVLGEHILVHFERSKQSAMVHGDKGMMEQVLMNLCVNARDAMPRGGTILIETECCTVDATYCARHVRAREGAYVLLRVTDTGTGMKREILDRIFEPFFSTKEEGKGTGLGLATVYGIVEQHQGFIDVWSELDQGTSFTVYLPQTGLPGLVPASEEDNKVVGVRRATILLAEDEELVRRLVIQILEGAGHTVLAVPSGEEALTVFERDPQRIDLLLLDLVMPGLSGVEVYAKVCERRPEVPVLFATGYTETPFHEELVLNKGMDLIQKPFSHVQLLNVVQRMLDEVKRA